MIPEMHFYWEIEEVWRQICRRSSPVIMFKSRGFNVPFVPMPWGLHTKETESVSNTLSVGNRPFYSG
jgi:hypothetical protein